MAVIYLPQRQGLAEALRNNDPVGAYIKANELAEERKRQDALMQLQTIMELGGTMSPEEVGGLEKTLRLSPGVLSGNAQAVSNPLMEALQSGKRVSIDAETYNNAYGGGTPATSIRIPGRIERQNAGQLALAEGQEKQAGKFFPQQLGRKSTEARTMTPIEAERAGSLAGASATATTRANLALAPEVTKAKVAEQTAMIPIAVEKAKQLHKQELDNLLEAYEKDPVKKAQITKMTIDLSDYKNKTLAEREKMQAEIDKLKAEAEKERASAAIQPSIGKFYEQGAGMRESQTSNAGAKLTSIDDAFKSIAAVGLGVYDDTTKKFTAIPYKAGDPKATTVIDDLTSKGYIVTEQDASRMTDPLSWGKKILQVSTPPTVVPKVGAATTKAIAPAVGLVKEQNVRNQLKAAGADDAYIEAYIAKAKKQGKL